MSDEPLSVLIAEDEPLASMALRAQVEALGHTVLAVARDGMDAAALSRCLPADLAILDMRMPRMTGLDAALQTFPDAPTPVLLLTGFGAADLPDPVPEPPVFALVRKPIGLSELRTGIRRAMDRFDAWLDHPDRREAVRRSREDRRAIARALQHLEGTLPATAAGLLDRARAEGATPAELARRIIADSPEG